MTAEDVLDILGFIGVAGIRAWVDGGWGIDALVGAQTRDHADLDIAVGSSDDALLRDACAHHGFVEVSAEPHNPVLTDGRGRTLDVHFVDLTVTRPGERGWEVYGDISYDVGAFEGSGVIGGMQVACTTAVSQLRSHSGYAFDTDDIHDVLTLCHALGLEIPPEYRPRLGSAFLAEDPRGGELEGLIRTRQDAAGGSPGLAVRLGAPPDPGRVRAAQVIPEALDFALESVAFDAEVAQVVAEGGDDEVDFGVGTPGILAEPADVMDDGWAVAAGERTMGHQASAGGSARDSRGASTPSMASRARRRSSRLP